MSNVSHRFLMPHTDCTDLHGFFCVGAPENVTQKSQKSRKKIIVKDYIKDSS